MNDLGKRSPALAGTRPVLERMAGMMVHMVWRMDEVSRADRLRGVRYVISREKRNEPTRKVRIEVPDLIHRVGCEYGWPVMPSPTYTVLPAVSRTSESCHVATSRLTRLHRHEAGPDVEHRCVEHTRRETPKEQDIVGRLGRDLVAQPRSNTPFGVGRPVAEQWGRIRRHGDTIKAPEKQEGEEEGDHKINAVIRL